MRTKLKHNLKWEFIWLFIFIIILIFNLLIHDDRFPNPLPQQCTSFIKQYISRNDIKNFFSYFLVPFASPITFWVLAQITKSNDEIETKAKS